MADEDRKQDEDVDERFKRSAGGFLDMVDEFIENELPFLDRFNKRKARDTINEGRESLQFPKRDPLTIARENLDQVSQFVRDKAGFDINVPRIFAGFRKPTLQEELDRANRRRN